MMGWLRLTLRISLVVSWLVAALTGLILAVSQYRSPSPARLTFVVEEDHRLHIDQFDGHDQTRLIDGNSLTESAVSRGDQMTWSPDGTRLAYWGAASSVATIIDSGPMQIKDVQQIRMLDTRDNTVSLLAELAGDLPRNDRVSWSADSRRLAFTSDGLAVTIITPGSPETPSQQIDPQAFGLPYILAHSPAWSPTDPELLAMVAVHPSDEGAIVLIRPDQPEAGANVLVEGLQPISNLTWRGNGQGLTYRQRLNITMHIYYDLLARIEQPISLTFADPYFVQWSPDGSKYLALSPYRRQILVTGAPGSELELLVNLPEGHSLLSLAWSPDSRQIAYLAETPGGGCALYLVDVAFKIQQRILPDQRIQCYVDLAWQPLMEDR